MKYSHILTPTSLPPFSPGTLPGDTPTMHTSATELSLAMQVLEGLVLLHPPSARYCKFEAVMPYFARPSSAVKATHPSSATSLVRTDSGVELDDSLLDESARYSGSIGGNAGGAQRLDIIDGGVRQAALQLTSALLAHADAERVREFVRCGGLDAVAGVFNDTPGSEGGGGCYGGGDAGRGGGGGGGVEKVLCAEIMHLLQHNALLDLSSRVSTVKALERRVGRLVVSQLRSVKGVKDVGAVLCPQ